MNRKLVNLLLLLAVVLMVCLSLVVGARHTEGEEGEKFGGTDSKVTEVLEEQGAEPWFSPIFEPGSGEVESGLFAMQAALGAGVLGYCLGVMRGRRQGRRDVEVHSAASPTAVPEAPTRLAAGPDGHLRA